MNASLESVISIVANVLEMDPSKLEAGTAAEAVEAWDSLRHLAIITAVEEAYDLELPMDVIAEIDGIAALHQAVVEARQAV